MKRVYQINFELTEESYREQVESQIKKLGQAFQVLGSTWIVSSKRSHSQLCGMIANSVKEGISIIVTELAGPADWINLDLDIVQDGLLAKALIRAA